MREPTPYPQFVCVSVVAVVHSLHLNQTNIIYQHCRFVCVHVTLSGEWETSVWPQFTGASIAPVSILCFKKTTYSELVNRSSISVESISMVSSAISDSWSVSESIQYHESKTKGYKMHYGFYGRDQKARHLSLEDQALAKRAGSIAPSLFSSSAWKCIQEATDRYNTCMWLSGLEIAGGAGGGDWRQFGGRDWICAPADNASFTVR